MTWAELHSESERLAIQAEFARKSRNFSLSAELYKRAAELEQKAFYQLDAEKVRTKGITAVSAVALWFKAGDYAAAEQLAHAMLADSSMPEFAREGLRNLVQAIWTESSKLQAGVAFLPGQVMVSVKGGEVVTGGAPLDLIVDKVQTIQALFYRTVEFLSGAAHRKTGTPARELQDVCRPWLFQAAPGSYQFSVAIQKPPQPDFFKEDVEPERIALHFLEIVNASANASREELARLVPDEQYRGTFLKLTRNLAPTGKTFERIEFRAAGEFRPVSLGVASRANINQQLRSVIGRDVRSEKEEPVELRGVLRAVHLDKDWLDVLVNGESVHVVGLQDTVDDVIGPMVNRPVIVRIIRGRRKNPKFLDIELDE